MVYHEVLVVTVAHVAKNYCFPSFERLYTQTFSLILYVDLRMGVILENFTTFNHSTRKKIDHNNILG